MLVCALLVGCGIYKPEPKIEITHVLAVTSEGDTLRLPISMIKSNVYYNITHYPHRYYNLPYNTWHHNNWHYNNYTPIYVRPSTGSNNNNNSNNNSPNTGSSKPAPAVINPPSTPVAPNRGGGRN